MFVILCLILCFIEEEGTVPYFILYDCLHINFLVKRNHSACYFVEGFEVEAGLVHQ